MLDIKSFDDWTASSKATDPIQQIKGYGSYLKESYFKSGQPIPQDEIDGMLREKAKAVGLVNADTTEEDLASLQDQLFKPETKDNGVGLLASYFQNQYQESQFQDLDARKVRDKLDLYQHSKRLGSVAHQQLQPEIEELSNDRELMNKAKEDAVKRGELPVAFVEDDQGQRRPVFGRNFDSDTVRGQLDVLLKQGAVSHADLPELQRELEQPFGAANRGQLARQHEFNSAVEALRKQDNHLSEQFQNYASEMNRKAARESMSGGERAFDTAGNILSGVIGGVGEVVSGIFGTPSAIGAQGTPDLMLAGNQALLKQGFSEEEIERFSADYIKRIAGPAYRADKPETGIDVDSTGTPIIANGLAANKKLFDEALSKTSLSETQKRYAEKQREFQMQAATPEYKRLILANDSDAISAYAEAKKAGKTDTQFVEEWVAKDDQNYNWFAERTQQMGMSIAGALVDIPLAVAAAVAPADSLVGGIATDTMVAMHKDKADRQEYARLMGDEFGLGTDIMMAIPQVGVDIAATLGTTGGYVALKTAASGGAKGIARAALKNTMSQLDEPVKAALRTALIEGNEATLSATLKDVGLNMAAKLNKAEQMAPLFATSFARSASASYASLYSQMPDDLSHAEKHERALKFSLATGLATGLVTTGFSLAGYGGLEDLATKTLRPLTGAADDVASKVTALENLTFKQFKSVVAANKQFAGEVTDDVAKRELRKVIGSAYKQYFRNVFRGAVDEGIEEAVDQFASIKIEDAATGKATTVGEMSQQIMHAFVIGGALGAGSPAVSQIAMSPSETEEIQAQMSYANRLMTTAGRLQQSGAPETATVFENIARRVNDRVRGIEQEAHSRNMANAASGEKVADLVDDVQPVAEPAKPKSAFTPTMLLADAVGSRVHVAGYTGTLEKSDNGEMRLRLAKPDKDGTTHVRISGSPYQPLSQSGVSFRKQLLTLREKTGSFEAGTPVLQPESGSKKLRYAIPASPKIDFVFDVGSRKPIMVVRDTPQVGNERLQRDIIVTDSGLQKQIARRYNISIPTVKADVLTPQETSEKPLEFGLWLSDNGASTSMSGGTLLLDTPAPLRPAEQRQQGELKLLPNGVQVVSQGSMDMVRREAIRSRLDELDSAEAPTDKKQAKAIEQERQQLSQELAAIEQSMLPTAPASEPSVEEQMVDEEIALEQNTVAPPPPNATPDQTAEYLRAKVGNYKMLGMVNELRTAGGSPEVAAALATKATPRTIKSFLAAVEAAQIEAEALPDSQAAIRRVALESLATAELYAKKIAAAGVGLPAQPAPAAQSPAKAEAAQVKEEVAKRKQKRKSAKKPKDVLEENETVEDQQIEQDLEQMAAEGEATVVSPVTGEEVTKADALAYLSALQSVTNNPNEFAEAAPEVVAEAKEEAEQWQEAMTEAEQAEVRAELEEELAAVKEEDPETTSVRNRLQAIQNPTPTPAARLEREEATEREARRTEDLKSPIKQKGVKVPFRNTWEKEQFDYWVEKGYIVTDHVKYAEFHPQKLSGVSLGQPFGKDTVAYARRLRLENARLVRKRFPLIPVPKEVADLMVEDKQNDIIPKVSQMKMPDLNGNGPSTTRALPYTPDSVGGVVNGFFTNDPLTTAAQLDAGMKVFVPASLRNSDSINPTIEFDKVSGEVLLVKLHPNHTGVRNKGDLSSVSEENAFNTVGPKEKQQIKIQKALRFKLTDAESEFLEDMMVASALMAPPQRTAEDVQLVVKPETTTEDEVAVLEEAVTEVFADTDREAQPTQVESTPELDEVIAQEKEDIKQAKQLQSKVRSKSLVPNMLTFGARRLPNIEAKERVINRARMTMVNNMGLRRIATAAKNTLRLEEKRKGGPVDLVGNAAVAKAVARYFKGGDAGPATPIEAAQLIRDIGFLHHPADEHENTTITRFARYVLEKENDKEYEVSEDAFIYQATREQKKEERSYARREKAVGVSISDALSIARLDAMTPEQVDILLDVKGSENLTTQEKVNMLLEMEDDFAITDLEVAAKDPIIANLMSVIISRVSGRPLEALADFTPKDLVSTMVRHFISTDFRAREALLNQLRNTPQGEKLKTLLENANVLPEGYIEDKTESKPVPFVDAKLRERLMRDTIVSAENAADVAAELDIPELARIVGEARSRIEDDKKAKKPISAEVEQRMQVMEELVQRAGVIYGNLNRRFKEDVRLTAQNVLDIRKVIELWETLSPVRDFPLTLSEISSAERAFAEEPEAEQILQEVDESITREQLLQMREQLEQERSLSKVALAKRKDGAPLTPQQVAAAQTRLEEIRKSLKQVDSLLRTGQQVLEPTPMRKDLVQRVRMYANTMAGPLFSVSASDTLVAEEAERSNRAEQSKLKLESGNIESVIGALQQLANEGTPDQKLVAGLLLAHADTIRTVGFQIIKTGDPRFAGSFLPDSNVLLLNLSGHDGVGFANVLLHELLHAITAKGMAGPLSAEAAKAKERIGLLRRKVAERLRAKGVDIGSKPQLQAALASDEEFIVGVLTDPNVQAFVKAATPSGQTSLFRRAATSIVRFLQRLVGIQSVDAQLEKAVETMLDFTNLFAHSDTYKLDARRTLASTRPQQAEAVAQFLDTVRAARSLDEVRSTGALLSTAGPIDVPVPAGFTAEEDPISPVAVRYSRGDAGRLIVNRALLDRQTEGYSGQAKADALRGAMEKQAALSAAFHAIPNSDFEAASIGMEESALRDMLLEQVRSAAETTESAMRKVDYLIENKKYSASHIVSNYIMDVASNIVSGVATEEEIQSITDSDKLRPLLVRALNEFAGRSEMMFRKKPLAATAARMSFARRMSAQISTDPASVNPTREAGEDLFDALAGIGDPRMAHFDIPIYNNDSSKAARFVERLKEKFYSLPSALRDIVNFRNASINKAQVEMRSARRLQKLIDVARNEGASMADISALFGTTAATVTNADRKAVRESLASKEEELRNEGFSGQELNDKLDEFESAQYAAIVNKFNREFRKAQKASEARLVAAGYTDLVREAVTLRESINKLKGKIGMDESGDVYLTRSYQFFTTDGWSKMALHGGQQVINGQTVDFDRLRAAAASLYEEQVRKQFERSGEQYTEEQVVERTKNMLDMYLSKLNEVNLKHAVVGSGESNAIRQDLNRLKPKADIDGAMRALLGENTDPLFNALTTMQNVALMAANADFQRDFSQIAIALGLASKRPLAKGWERWKDPQQRESYGPLAGLYMDKSIAAALEEIFGGEAHTPTTAIAENMNVFHRGLARASAVSVLAKTRYGIGYWFRNAAGGLLLSSAQGIFVGRKGLQSFDSARRAAFGRLSGSEQRDEILRLVELGVANDRSQSRVVQDMMRGMLGSSQQELQEVVAEMEEARLTKDSDSAWQKLMKNKWIAGAASLVKNTNDGMAALDTAIENMYRINAYYFEKEVMDKHYGDSRSEEFKEREAAKKVQRTFPGSSQMVDPVKAFQRSPLALAIIPFISWKSEVFRTMFNTPALAIEEMKQGGVMARRGVRRLVFFSATLTAAPAIVGAVAAAIFQGLTGGEDEERELTSTEKWALRLALPNWQQGHSLYAHQLKDGSVRFIDMTYMLPHTQLTDTVQIIIDGLKNGEGIDSKRLGYYLANEWIGSQIASGTVVKALSNEDDFGRPIWLASDSGPDVMRKFLSYVATQAYKPSVVSKTQQAIREGEKRKTDLIAGEFLGVRPKFENMDVLTLRAMQKLKTEYDEVVREGGRLSTGKLLDQETTLQYLDERQQGLNATRARLRKAMQIFEGLNVKTNDLFSSGTQAGFSQKNLEATYAGYSEVWTGMLNDRYLEKLYGNMQRAGEQDPQERIKWMQEWLAKESEYHYIGE